MSLIQTNIKTHMQQRPTMPSYHPGYNTFTASDNGSAALSTLPPSSGMERATASPPPPLSSSSCPPPPLGTITFANGWFDQNIAPQIASGQLFDDMPSHVDPEAMRLYFLSRYLSPQATVTDLPPQPAATSSETVTSASGWFDRDILSHYLSPQTTVKDLSPQPTVTYLQPQPAALSPGIIRSANEWFDREIAPLIRSGTFLQDNPDIDEEAIRRCCLYQTLLPEPTVTDLTPRPLTGLPPRRAVTALHRPHTLRPAAYLTAARLSNSRPSAQLPRQTQIAPETQPSFCVGDHTASVFADSPANVPLSRNVKPAALASRSWNLPAPPPRSGRPRFTPASPVPHRLDSPVRNHELNTTTSFGKPCDRMSRWLDGLHPLGSESTIPAASPPPPSLPLPGPKYVSEKLIALVEREYPGYEHHYRVPPKPPGAAFRQPYRKAKRLPDWLRIANWNLDDDSPGWRPPAPVSAPVPAPIPAPVPTPVPPPAQPTPVPAKRRTDWGRKAKPDPGWMRRWVEETRAELSPVHATPAAQVPLKSQLAAAEEQLAEMNRTVEKLRAAAMSPSLPPKPRLQIATERLERLMELNRRTAESRRAVALSRLPPPAEPPQSLPLPPAPMPSPSPLRRSTEPERLADSLRLLAKKISGPLAHESRRIIVPSSLLADKEYDPPARCDHGCSGTSLNDEFDEIRAFIGRVVGKVVSFGRAVFTKVRTWISS